VLAVPPFGVATQDAYRWFDEDGGHGSRETMSPAGGEIPSRPLFPNVALVNDLEPPVVARYPVIGQLRQRLAELGALRAAMSGSGSTVFGVFTSKGKASIAARALLRAGGTGVLTARFLGRRRA
jgi:4-diphosphocytidyl-2-C-methyl-D-erythritol kinase